MTGDGDGNNPNYRIHGNNPYNRNNRNNVKMITLLTLITMKALTTLTTYNYNLNSNSPNSFYNTNNPNKV